MKTTVHRARQLVMEFGWNSTAYQILNPGIEHWFSSAAPGVVGFVPRGNWWVVAGAPVCAAESLARLTEEFEQQAHALGKRVCYVGAAARLERHFRDSSRHARIAIGAQPVWNPQEWTGIVKSRASLRSQLSRARHKGVSVALQEAEAARDDAGLQTCLREWLQNRPLPPMHFLVEPATFGGELADRILLVARQRGTVVGFLLASPIPQRRGYLVEQIIRASHAPNGTAELLIDTLMAQLADSGGTYLTMGLVPLTTYAQGWMQENPLWLRGVMTWARAHGRRFYHFDGLEHFRAKMSPDRWEPIFAISNEERFSAGSLVAMLGAFAKEPLPWMVARGLARAVATEMGRALRMAG